MTLRICTPVKDLQTAVTNSLLLNNKGSACSLFYPLLPGLPRNTHGKQGTSSQQELQGMQPTKCADDIVQGGHFHFRPAPRS